MEWTPENIDKLRKLFVEKKMSYREISAEWEGTTLGMIAGRCRKYGFVRVEDARPNTRLSSKPKPPEPVKMTKPKVKAVAKPKKLAAPAPKPKTKPVAVASPKPPAEVVLLARTPNIGTIPVERLESHHCRWPTNDDKPFVFCGKHKDGTSSYCAEHRKKMFVPAKPVIRHTAR